MGMNTVIRFSDRSAANIAAQNPVI